MASTPFGSMSDDPFRGFEYLTGRLSGAPESWPPRPGGVQRVDVGGMLSGPGRELLAQALQRAARRGAPDLDVLDLLGAAARTDPARGLLRAAGAEPDALLARVGDLTGSGTPGEAPTTLTPAAKRALLDSQRISRALQAGYIGPEHLLLALAANPDAAAARLLAAQAEFGARPLRRALRREVDDPLSRMLLNGEIPEGAHVRIDAGDDVALAIDVHSAPVTGTATVAGTTTGADNTGGTDV